MENIIKTRVADDKRMDFLPRHVGKKFLEFEMNVYGWMETLCPDYKGGYWQFYELSNGGFYMTMTKPCRLCSRITTLMRI